MFDLFKSLIDFILHIDQNLAQLVMDYKGMVYLILFAIVFVETGFIVMPLLPGDSLLFAAGALAANPDTGLNVLLIIPLLIVAALCGDNLNYFVGHFFSKQIKKRDRILFFKKEYISRTEDFYQKHGGKTVIMARFVPIVRTVAPFVAGAGSMPYGRYILYCISGAILWVVGLTMLGYIFGNIPIVKNNFEVVILGIIGLSVLPIIIGYLKARFGK
jgi:membrane-associated protein